MAAAALTLASMASAQNSFIIKGYIDGMADSTRVTVVEVGNPSGRNALFAEGTSRGGNFEIEGRVTRPTLAKLSFSRYDPVTQNFSGRINVNFMLGPDAYTVTGLGPYDAIAESKGPTERMFSFVGGKAQTEYNIYLDSVGDLQHSAEQASYTAVRKQVESRNNPDTMRHYKAASVLAAEKLQRARMAFVKLNPAYHISSYIVGQELARQFAYTAPEIEEMATLVAANPDTAMTGNTARMKAQALTCALNSVCPPFEVTAPDGAAVPSATLLKPGRLTFIDFWASWCHPCRKAIPHVRELYRKYGDRLRVISVSVDLNEAAWRKAMDEEKMEWAQYLASGAQQEQLSKIFHLRSIPRLIVLDPEGRIVCFTHLPEAAAECIAGYLD